MSPAGTLVFKILCKTLRPTSIAERTTMARTGGNMAQDHFGEAIRNKFFEFLEGFTTANAAYSMSQASGGTAAEEAQQQFYVEQLKAMRESEKTTLYVDWQHLVSVDADLADELELQYLRIDPFLRKVSRLDQHSRHTYHQRSPPALLSRPRSWHSTPVPPCSFLGVATGQLIAATLSHRPAGDVRAVETTLDAVAQLRRR